MPMKRELTEKEREMIRDFILRDKEFEEGTVEFTLSDEERKEMPEWEAKERAEFERWCPITIIDASKAPKTTALKQAYWTAWQARARHAEGQAATRMSHGIDVQAFWDAQAEWSQATFGTDQDRDHIGPLKHLAKEAVEAQVRPSDPFEIADCLFLTFDAARRSGLTLTKLIEVCNEKLAINKARKWDKPTDDNPVEHVRVATQTPLTPAGTDRLLTAIDAYRSGYSCGYADAKNGQSMRDKDAACLFFGVHGVPDIAASPDAKTREAIANVRLDQGECGTRLVPEHAANEYRVFQAEHDDSGSKNKHLIVWRGTETLKAEEVEAALNEPCGCCSTMLEELIEFTKCPDNEDVVEHVKRLLGAAPQLPDCSGCTNPYSEGTHCWETKQHPQPSMEICPENHPWQPAASTEAKPDTPSCFICGGPTKMVPYCAECDRTNQPTKPTAQPGEDARRVAKIIDEEVPVDMFDNSDEGAEKYRRQVAEVIQSSIDSATRELKAELDKTTKERDDLLKSYDLDDKAAWALNKGLAEADEKTDKLESEVSQLKAESAKKDFALDQADKNLKLLYSEVSRLTAELAALRVSHGKLLKTATGITDCLRDLKLLPARDASTQSTPAATQGKEKTE